jgi:membrane fusion protein (multidrug efflux system)
METYLEITAPFDGVITERNVHPGSLVGPSTGALLRIEQVARLRLTVPVPEAYVGTITRRATVQFRCPRSQIRPSRVSLRVRPTRWT